MYHSSVNPMDMLHGASEKAICIFSQNVEIIFLHVNSISNNILKPKKAE